MATSHMLWLTLEALPGAEAVLAEWQSRLAEDFDSVRSLLRQTDRPAGGYPVSIATGMPYRVVQHGPNDFAAVPPDGGETIDLKLQDVLVHRLDHRKLAKEIATAFDFAPTFEVVAGIPSTWRIGAARRSSGSDTVVHLVVPFEPDDLHRAIQAIIAQCGEPGVVIAPTRGCLKAASESLLRMGGGHFIALGDALKTRDGCEWSVRSDAADALARFLHPDAIVRDAPLSDRAQSVLIAMLELSALDSDRRRTAEEITAKALGDTADANALKSVMAELKTLRFVESKRGSGGGSWLTDSGQSRARKLGRM